jgi:hypothetical protein
MDTFKMEISNKAMAIIVVIIYILQIVANALSSVFSNSTGLNIGQISDANPTYITPDGRTFSVWGVIYTLLLIYTIYQALPSHHDDKQLVASRPYVIGAFILNGIWLFLWTNYLWWIQWLDIVLYLVALIYVYRHLNINYSGSDKSWQYIVSVYSGFSANVAWVTAATVISTTTTFRNSGWVTSSNVPGEHAVGATADWAIMWLVVVAGISSILALYRADLVHNLITAWALSGIVRQQTTPNATAFPISLLSNQVANWALACEIVVLVAALVSLIKIIYAAYIAKKNKDTESPPSALERPMLVGPTDGAISPGVEIAA